MFGRPSRRTTTTTTRRSRKPIMGNSRHTKLHSTTRASGTDANLLSESPYHPYRNKLMANQFKQTILVCTIAPAKLQSMSYIREGFRPRSACPLAFGASSTCEPFTFPLLTFIDNVVHSGGRSRNRRAATYA